MKLDSSITPQAGPDLFESTVESIRQTYEAMGYRLGWRFLNSSRASLHASSGLAVITLNPAGKDRPIDQPEASCEDGHSYLTEQWGTSERGCSSLQIQLQKLFRELNKYFKAPDANTLINESLSGYYIPFRSPRLADLPRPKEAFEFAESIWTNILKYTEPKLIICIDKKTFKGIQNIYIKNLQSHTFTTKSLPTGWGRYTADIASLEQLRILRLPHLSTFKLFSSDKCKPFMQKIIAEACTGIS